jgi:hypothetical protein
MLAKHSPAQVQPFAHQRLPSRGGFLIFVFGSAFRSDLLACVRVPVGILKFSPRCSTAQHRRAFFAAMATNAHQ